MRSVCAGGKSGTRANRRSAGAEKIVEPKRQDLEDSGAMYVAMREVVQRRSAKALNLQLT